MSRRRRYEEETGTSRATGADYGKGKISVAEAGRRGGAKGGPRVRELIREGKEHEEE